MARSGGRLMPAVGKVALYLVRHGEPDWASMNGRALPGGINDLVDLTPAGIAQAKATAQRLVDVGAVKVVSSPMTRALQTAAVIAAALELPLSVEFDLREWCPDTTYRWATAADAAAAYADMLDCDGEWPAGETRGWEPLSAVRARSLAVLDRVSSADGATIAVCHGVVIQAVTGQVATDHGSVVLR